MSTHKKRYISPEDGQQIIDELRLVPKNYKWFAIYKNRIPKNNDLFDNASNQPSKYRTRNWVEINDESRGTYIGNNIQFKTTMLRSNLCDYIHIL